ncbi:MAG: hypothetical protein U0270_27575 [Labilithrix sp.]
MKFARSSVVTLGCLVVVGCAGTASEDASRAEADVTAPSSAYTSLNPAECQDLPTSGANEVPFSQQSCAGMPGWSLLVEDFDSRNNVQVKFGDRAMDLEVWNRLPAFSHLGPKAEWRGPVKSPGVVDPYALIFRFFQTDGEGKESSFLVVSRITPTASCIVGLVNGGEADGNQKAREMADNAKSYVCPGADAPPPNATSVFTPMENCTVTASSDEGDGWSESACTGTSGYSLGIDSGDLRDNVIVNTPSGKKVDLEIWGLGGGGFSHVGPTADWRVHGPSREVHAVVFRRHMTIDEQGTENNTLVVVKIQGDLACVYDHIDAKKHPDANVLAHVAADASFSKACPAEAPAAH